jgi:hypothetical protein
MCHDSCSNIEATEIFSNPETELDPMHLSLCPNCASLYRKIRNNSAIMDIFKKDLLELTEAKITADDYVQLDIEDQELWFTQIHIAEVQALLRLAEDVRQGKKEVTPIESVDDEGDKGGLSVYSSYIGNCIKRKDGFLAEVVGVDDQYLTVKVIQQSRRGGPKAGEETKIQLSFVISNSGVYEIISQERN